MKKFRAGLRSENSTLGLRLWEFTGTALLNLFVFILLAVYLSPLSYMIVTSLKTRDQLQDGKAPLWPGEAQSFEYDGKERPLYEVPTTSGIKQLALVEAHTQYSMLVDPAQPDGGLIRINGFYRSWDRVYSPKSTLKNYSQLWQVLPYPHILRNTLFVVVVSGIGVIFSSIAVAYGFSRFRIPGGRYLFILLIATIMIPDSILLLPSFVIYTRVLGWNGSYLPLIVPQFFGSTVYIFLLRQNFKSIPRDLDEAAMLDGASPLRILISIILPQSIPAVTTVVLLHFFNMWNELRVSSLYLGTRNDLQTIAFTATFTPTVGFTPEMLQASALLMLLVPAVVLFLSQRYFMQDMVITGLEK